MDGSLPNLHTMVSGSACIQGVLKVKVKVKVNGHVMRALSWIFEMSYSVIDGLVSLALCCVDVYLLNVEYRVNEPSDAVVSYWKKVFYAVERDKLEF